MAIVKYLWVFLGYGLYIFINILSYTHPSFAGPLSTKIIFSILSFVFMSIDALFFILTKRITKREWKELSLYTRISVVLGIVILPLVSLYYT
jgi:hypothetical protein